MFEFTGQELCFDDDCIVDEPIVEVDEAETSGSVLTDLTDRDDVFDTFDQITDSPDSDNDGLLEDFDGLNEEGIAIALAFGEALAESKNRRYELNASTDEQNWKRAMIQNAGPSEDNSKLRPFEQHIDDICSGRLSLFSTGHGS